MNKNLLKIGALALGMFVCGAILMGTSNAATDPGQLQLTITGGTSECVYGTSLNLGAQAVKLNEAYEFSGDFAEEFYCTDYRGNSYGPIGGWTFYISADVLSNGNGNLIDANNVSINHSVGQLSGDSNCTAGTSTDTTRTPLNPSVYTLIERAEGSNGICAVAIERVSLKVNVPANQAPGTYVGTLTLTVPNF